MIKKIFCFAILLFALTNAQANPIKKIVFFGDSLTDNGNLHTVLSFMPKSPPYYAGRFSNGPVWSDTMAQYFQNKYAIESSNYAVGGATVELLNPFEGNLPYVLSQEVDRYLFNTMFKSRDDTLFVIWIGANDYTGGRTSVAKATDKVIKKMSETLNRLIEHGGQYFLILNLPDLAKTPYAKTISFSENIRELSKEHNGKLLKLISTLKKDKPLVHITYFDIGAVFSDIINNTEKYNKEYHKNFKTLDVSCWTGGYRELENNTANDMETLKTKLQKTMSLPIEKSKQIADNLARHMLKDTALLTVYEVEQLAAMGVTPCEHPDEYLFWDKVHPTTDTHDVIAQLIVKTTLDLIK